MKEIYQQILLAIAIFVPEIKYIRLFNNQFDNQNKETPIIYPCLFVEFTNDINYQGLASNTQMGNVNITVHLGFESYVYEDLEILDLKDKVHFALQNLNYGTFSGLQRIAERTDVNHNNIYIFQMDYKTSFLDASTYINKNQTSLTGVTTSITGTTISITGFTSNF